LIILTLPLSGRADVVEFEDLLTFPSLVPAEREWKASLDCRAAQGIRMSRTTELEQEIRSALRNTNIRSTDRNRYTAYAYLTEFTCTHDGYDDKTNYPLHIVTITDNKSSVVGRIVIEIFENSTGQLVDSAEIEVKGIITEWHAFFLPIQTAYYYEDITEEAVWRKMLKEIVSTIQSRALAHN
jgi:hypothetical protein